MKVGLVAGSRGDVGLLDFALTSLCRDHGCARLFFLGEDFVDVDRVLGPASETGSAKPAPAASSDSGFLRAVTEFIEQHHQATSTDNELRFLDTPLLRVPERGCTAYEDDHVPNKILDMIGSSIVLAVHHKGDLVKDDIANARLIFHGDDDEAGLRVIGPRAFVSPGKLGVGDGSMAVLEALGAGYLFTTLRASGRVIEQRPLTLRSTTKISVR